MGFGEWLRAGGLEITCLMAVRFGALFCDGITALVTERTPAIRRFEANIEQLNLLKSVNEIDRTLLFSGKSAVKFRAKTSCSSTKTICPLH